VDREDEDEQKTPEGDKGETSAGKTGMSCINVFESGIAGLDTVDASIPALSGDDLREILYIEAVQ